MSLVAREGTVATLSGRRVGIGNVWPATHGRTAPTVTLHFEDDTKVEAEAGTVLELAPDRWRVAAVRDGHPHGEVTFEPAP